MSQKRKPYQTYTKAFKLEAVRMMGTSDRLVSEIAIELGIRRNQLYKWKAQLEKTGDVASSMKSRPKKEAQSEVARLRQEKKCLQEENDILKSRGVLCP